MNKTKDMKKHFLKESQMANQFMTKGSALLLIREMQIKITVKCLLTLLRMVMIRKTKSSKC